MFDPNQHAIACQKYLSRILASPVKFLDAQGLEYEYQILKALEPLAIPTARLYSIR